MTSEVLFCRNCNRGIAAANYVIHCVHCERKIQLCNVCNEPVPRSTMEVHMEEYHTLGVCELCNLKMERCQIETHKDSCIKRPVNCKFCELELPFDELDEHIDICGTRTEKCTNCNYYVMLKDLVGHRETCENDRQVNCVSCEYCEKNIPIDLFYEHFSTCGSQTEKCQKCNAFVLLKERNRHECKMVGSVDMLVSCEYCKINISSDHSYEHISTCGSQTEKCPNCSSFVMRKERNAHECKGPSKSHGECSICHEVVPWIDMREHESCCRLSIYQSDDDEETPNFSAAAVRLASQNNFRQPDSKLRKTTEDKKSSFKLNQCPYCKERFPDLIIKDHLETCKESPYKCELCWKTIPLKEKMTHETRDCQMIHGTNVETPVKESSYAIAASGYTKPYEKKLKLCPFCNEKFPDLMFKDHLDTCNESPHQCKLCLKSMPLKNKFHHDLKECKYKDIGKRQFSIKEDSNAAASSGHTNTYQKQLHICPYCNKRFPDTLFKDHMAGCNELPYHCKYCFKAMQFKDKFNHEEKECEYIKKINRLKGTDLEVPVYARNFEKTPLESNYKTCPYCEHKIPEIKIAEHVQLCSAGKKLCHFCGEEISIDQVAFHLEICIGARNVVEEQKIQNQGSEKKKKNKGKKNKQPTEQKGWFSAILTRKKEPVEDFTPQLPEVFLLPCEFCEELFPGPILIEHQSGCRPDLVCFPRNETSKPVKAQYSNDHKEIPGRNAEGGFKTALHDYRDTTNTGALPKRSKFLRSNPDVAPGEFLVKKSSPEKPDCDRDYFTYASGVPDYLCQSEDSSGKQHKILHPLNDTTSIGKAVDKSEDKKIAKHSSTSIFNFSSSSGKSGNRPANQPKSPLSRTSKFSIHNEAHTLMRHGFSKEDNTELKAVGAERAEKKGIIRISRDSVINSDVSDEASGRSYKEQISKANHSLHSIHGKEDLYSLKLNGSKGRLNTPSPGEASNIIESEKVKTTCATRLLSKLEDSGFSANIAEPWQLDCTEDDIKNDETFGNDLKDLAEDFTSLHADGNLSDSGEYFYDAEDNLKMSDSAMCDSSSNSPNKDSNLDVYFQFLMKGNDELVEANDIRKEESPSGRSGNSRDCTCGNEICYCNLINQPATLENNNNYLQDEAETFGEHLQKQTITAELLKLESHGDVKSATNSQCEEGNSFGHESHLKGLTTEVEKHGKETWKEWRKQEIYNSDTDSA